MFLDTLESLQVVVLVLTAGNTLITVEEGLALRTVLSGKLAGLVFFL